MAVGQLVAGPGGSVVGGSNTPAGEEVIPAAREAVEIQLSDASGVTFRVNTRLPDAAREELKRQLAALVLRVLLPGTDDPERVSAAPSSPSADRPGCGGSPTST